MRAALLAATCLAAAGSLSVAPATARAPRMQFDARLVVKTACFSVVNPHGTRSVLYGQHFTDSTAATDTPAIVLVHGTASSTADWDFSPSWSAARALASAGYVVISYDRLGFAKSPYTTGSGTTLTTAVQRGLLHQVVEQVKAGKYTITGRSDCSGSGRRLANALPRRKVIVLGHSAGGWVVAGYPGQYHDVAAMIKADITATTPTPLAPGGGFTPDPAHPDYYRFFQTRNDCETFNAFAPGAVQYVLSIACAPPFILTPFGEIGGLAQTYADNATYIPKIGRRVPVLLTSGAQDTTDPPSAAHADFAYYRAHCNCSVSQYIVPNTGHLFMAHRSLPGWIEHVVTWLSSHGLRPTIALPPKLSDTRRSPRGLAVKVVTVQLRKFPLRFRMTGSLELWSGMSPAQWCHGFVGVQAGPTTEKPATARTPVRRDCTFREGIRISGRTQSGRGRFLRLRFRFLGNEALSATAAKTFSYRIPGA